MNIFGKSCKKILLAFEMFDFVTQKKLVAETGLSIRTVKYKLAFLIAKGLVFEKANFSDMRRKSYFIYPWL